MQPAVLWFSQSREKNWADQAWAENLAAKKGKEHGPEFAFRMRWETWDEHSLTPGALHQVLMAGASMLPLWYFIHWLWVLVNMLWLCRHFREPGRRLKVRIKRKVGKAQEGKDNL